jgi:hypothetical protein
MQPVIGSGFGNFGRVLGPWTDYFPSGGGFGLADSQFGLAIGTKIQATAKGATITVLTVEPPFNIAGNVGAIPWKLYVIRGGVPPAVLAQLGNKFQHAVNGWPGTGDSDQDFPVLWSKLFAAITTVNNSTSSQQVHFPFPDMTGPSIGPGEIMTVFLTALFNETGVPGYGAANKTYASLTVSGVYDRRLPVGGDIDQTARSIPRGRVGGI